MPVDDLHMSPNFGVQQHLLNKLYFSNSEACLGSSDPNRLSPGRSMTLAPSNLDDLFSVEISSSPRYNSNQGGMLSISQVDGSQVVSAAEPVITRAETIQFPVRTNQIPREIPACKYPSLLLVLGTGMLPFGTLYIELFFILFPIWHGRFNNVFGFLLVVLLLVVIVCAKASIVLAYMHLCVEDWRWWWQAFFASGYVALYVFLYSIHYFMLDLKSLSRPVLAILYLGYSLIMALAIMLSIGTIGFLMSFYFVHYLFSSIKID